MKTYDIFISYRRSDGLIIAEALYQYLTSKGLRVFFDKHEMIDGHYFTTQIETNLKIAPNYVLIATDDVFNFRENEDWVRKEIEVAIEEYESNPIERTLTVLVPESVTFPEKETLPQRVCNIADAQRIALPYGEDFAEPFYKTLRAATNINRRNLWFAAHRWLENSKQPGGRFANLNIDESILSNASKNKTEQNAMPINVYSKDNVSENCQSLLDAMGSNSNHLYLIGQGGIGKTTALMHIMNNAYVDKQYSEKAQIPLFVELSFAPDTYGALYEGGKSTFIRRSIYKQVRADRTIKQVTAKEVSDVDEVFSSLPYDVAVRPITDILSKTTPAPEYLLLLDGLNEVSSVTVEETGLSVVQMIMREIDLLISECPNVRVVLTSRSDESAIYNESISRLYLSGVEDTVIKNYLENCELSKEQIDKALEDENLYETLQIPLFLTMYASLSKYDEVSTQGEILKLFFNERRRNISVYTMQERLVQLEKNITDVASAVQKNRIDADMQNFILDFILPEIAWSLERNGEFYLSIRSIRKIVEPVLVDTDDLAFCGEFGREIFSKYRNGASAKMHTYKVAKKILERLGYDITEVTESIINCCVFALGVMQESNGKYGFVHQHIRDYFAALKNINTIRLSVYLYEEGEKELALKCMNKAFKDETVNYNIRRFMGEYLGEHLNKPYYANDKWNYGVPAEKCDRNIIKRALDIYRGYFEGECGYGCYSLFNILKNVRRDLSGADFSNLDLNICTFDSAIFGRKNLSSKFGGSILKPYNIIPSGHRRSFSAIFDNSGNYFIADSPEDLNLRIWDICTFSLIKELNLQEMLNYTYSCRKILLYNNGNFIIVIPRRYISTDIPAIIDIENKKVVARIGVENSDYSCAAITPDERFVILCNGGGLEVWDLESFNMVISKIPAHNGTITSINFSPDKKSFVTSSFDETAKIWNYPKFFKIGELIGHTCLVNSASFSPDGKKIVTASSAKVVGKYTAYDATIRVWDSSDFSEILKIQESWHVENAVFDSTGQFIFSYNSATSDSDLKLYDAKTGETIQKLNTDGMEITAFSENPHKNLIVTIGNSIDFWDSKTFNHIHQLKSKRTYLKSIEYDRRSKKFIIASEDFSVKVLDRDTMKIIDALYPMNDTIISAKFSEDGDYILTITKNKNVEIWSNESYSLLYAVKGFSGFVKDVVMLNGQIFALSTNNNSNIEIFNLDSMKFDNRISVEEKIDHIIVNRKYNEIHAISRHNLYIWDIQSYKIKDVIFFDRDELRCMAKSAAENYLAIGCQRGTVFVFDVKNRKIIRIFHKWNATITALTFCSNDNRVLCYEYGAGYRIWDILNDHLLATFKSITKGYTTGLAVADDTYALASTESGFIHRVDFLNYNCFEKKELLTSLNITNADFKGLNCDSNFNDDDKSVLSQQGAIIN